MRLELTEEISEAKAAAPGGLGAVPIVKRTAQTTLVVRDQQTVVIGGLMRNRITHAETKIPLVVPPAVAPSALAPSALAPSAAAKVGA